MITREQAIKVLKELGACQDARLWFEYLKNVDPETAWNQCQQADWLIWLARHLEISKHKICFAIFECAKAVLHLVPKEEERSRQALELVEKWLAGEEVSEKELERAASEAYDAVEDAYSSAGDVVTRVSCACQTIYYVTAYVAPFGYSFHADSAIDNAYSSIEKSEIDSRIDFPGIVRKHISWKEIEEKLKKL